MNMTVPERTDTLESLDILFQTDGFNDKAVRLFRTVIYDYYRDHERDYPWRHASDPYKILVSEFMLQQTQTERVRNKYPAFIERFPDFKSLARAPLREVLEAWSGLGYNRRAQALKQTAQIVMDEYAGILPSDPETLKKFPGIGTATSAEIAAFAFGLPTIIMETNIRTVFIHFFFHGQTGITDKQILPLIEKSLDRKDPRNWYYALMDYGFMLKKNIPNPNRRSAHYVRQSRFEGSDRQIRGAVLKLLLKHPHMKKSDIIKNFETPASRVKKILDQMQEEGLILQTETSLTITGE